MSSVGDSVETSAVERGSLVMERCKAETKRSTKSTSPPASNPALATTPQLTEISSGADASPASSLQNPTLFPCDRTGQVAPVGMKPHVTTILWEDEGCLCFQVLAKGVWVSRRQDNNMINATKLLNVAGMTRGRRDGILKSEKNKHVVIIAPMHFKGVWISFERALELANKEKITESLYPLFLHSIGSLLDQPSHTKPNHPDDSQGKSQESDVWTPGNHDYIEKVNVLEHSDKSFQRPLDTVPNNEFNEQGPIGSLFRALTETLGLILVEVRMHSDTAQHYQSLESSCAALFFWDADLGLSRGDIDDILQNSPQLRDTCLAVLISISQFVSTSLIHLISSEDRQKKVLQLTGILASLEQVMNMVEEQNHSTWRPEQDAGTLCQGLRTKIDTFIMLAPSLASPAEESVDDEEPRMIEDVEVYLPEQSYANSISYKFPLAASAIVAHLGRLNWDRYNHMLRLQRETMQQELITSTMKKAGTIFHDSGVGTSLPVPCPETVYAPSMVSARAEASHKRVPPLPPQARSGEPFTCEICNKKVQFQRTTVWKKHVFEDILAYACFFAECSDTGVFENGKALMMHLEGHHGMDVRVSDVACPLCVEFTSRDRDVLSLHIIRHLEEIALAILPSGVDLDEEPADEESTDEESVDELISGVTSSEVIELVRGNPNVQATRKSRRYLSDKKFHDTVAEAFTKPEGYIEDGESTSTDELSLSRDDFVRRRAEVRRQLSARAAEKAAADLDVLEQDWLHRRAAARAAKKATADLEYDSDLHGFDFKTETFASSKKKREGAATVRLGQVAGSEYKTPREARRVREAAVKAYINTEKVEKHPNASTSSSVPSNMPSPEFNMGNIVHKAVMVSGMRTKGVFTISHRRFIPKKGHWEYRLKNYYNEQQESEWTRERDLKSER